MCANVDRFVLAAADSSVIQRLWDSQAIAIAITGMLIVFVALTLISVFIALLPRILAVVSHRLPEPTGGHAHSVSHTDATAIESTSRSDDDAVLAAIGFVLQFRHQNQRKKE